MSRGGASPYALCNMESLMKTLTNKYICLYNLKGQLLKGVVAEKRLRNTGLSTTSFAWVAAVIQPWRTSTVNNKTSGDQKTPQAHPASSMTSHSTVAVGLNGDPSYKTMAAPAANAPTIQFHIIQPVWKARDSFRHT